MQLNSLNDVYVHLLRDLHSAETQLLRALPKMAKAASNATLQEGFLKHAEQTREHVKRIEQLCADLGVKPTGKKCEGMAGLINEAEDALKEKGDPASKDAAMIVDAQKIEHYEIAGYGSAQKFAETLGLTKHARILQKTLNEEYKTDERLDKVAMKNVNLCSLEEGGDEKKASRAKTGAKKTAKKTASVRGTSKSAGSKSKSIASKSPTKKSSSAKSASSKSSGSKSTSGNGSTSSVTTNHEKIRRWVEERGGHPACVKGTGSKKDTGLLRIDYPGYSGADSLQAIEWDEFFEKFDKEKLAFLHQEKTANGKKSRFSKLVSRKNAK